MSVYIEEVSEYIDKNMLEKIKDKIKSKRKNDIKYINSLGGGR